MKSKVTYPDGVTVDYTYEPHRDLLTGVRNSRGETVYSEYLYANDALGRRTAKNGERYSYNVRSELTSATDSVHAANCYAYNYDDIGNRIASSERGTNIVYTTNNLNQYEDITLQTLQTFQTSFDADGNQTLVKTSTGTWQVEYNGENRPIRWTRGDDEHRDEVRPHGTSRRVCRMRRQRHEQAAEISLLFQRDTLVASDEGFRLLVRDA